MMKSFLLDTNVISELMTAAPSPPVVAFLSALSASYLSVITLHELQYGLNLLPDGQRKDLIQSRLQDLLQGYADCIISVTPDIATQAAAFRSNAKQQGRVVHLADALIAASAKVENCAVATRNVKDFAGLGVEVVNPWDEF